MKYLPIAIALIVSVSCTKIEVDKSSPLDVRRQLGDPSKQFYSQAGDMLWFYEKDSTIYLFQKHISAEGRVAAIWSRDTLRKYQIKILPEKGYISPLWAE